MSLGPNWLAALERTTMVMEKTTPATVMEEAAMVERMALAPDASVSDHLRSE